MAPQRSSPLAAPLRLINNRLSSTPTWQLPQVVPSLATTLAACGPVFSRMDEPTAKDGSDESMLVHRIKTRISTLLQDKDPKARWAALVLVKATIEAGGLAVLRGSSAWIRRMIDILGRPESSSTKKLILVTLTRCFLLVQGQQSLTRELTTPVLPAFLTACVKILNGSKNVDESLNLITLQALNELLPHHPASFRPFQNQIRSCILPMLAPTPSSLEELDAHRDVERLCAVTAAIADTARRTCVLLSVCAPKKTEADEWAKSFRLVCETIHLTADRVFRAFIEDRRPAGNQDLTQASGDTVSSLENDPMELSGWIGIPGGIERLAGLLKTLQAFLVTSTNYPVAIPVGLIVDVFNRLMSIHPGMSGAQINVEITRGEREGLLQGLPHVHAIAISLVSSLIARLKRGAASFYQEILESCMWIFDLEHSSFELRVAVYRATRLLIDLFGLAIPESLNSLLSICLTRCCEDILPSAIRSQENQSNQVHEKKSTTNGVNHTSADAYLHSALKHPSPEQLPTQVQTTAAGLISVALRNLPDRSIACAVRARIDRTVLLAADQDMLLASILYPPTSGQQNRRSTSLLPFLAREYPGSFQGEALMRPRMPVIQMSQDSMDLMDESVRNSESEEPTYDQLYSGSGVSNVDLPERRYIVEDSNQAEDEPQGAVAATMSNDLTSPSYTQPVSTDVSMVEVPETQPISAATSNKRLRAHAIDDQPAVQRSNASFPETGQPTVTDPKAKRARLAASVDLSDPLKSTRSTHEEESKVPVIAGPKPINAANPQMEAGVQADAPSDSEDSAIPEIYTSLDSDDEDDESDLNEAPS